MGDYHPTKTYRGQPACIGSGIAPVPLNEYTGAYEGRPFFYIEEGCPHCRREDLGRTSAGNLSTHLPTPRGKLKRGAHTLQRRALL